MQEIRECIVGFDPSLVDSWDIASPASLNGFRLENGSEELSAYFSNVILHVYEDGLIIAEAEPLVAYIRSTPPGKDLSQIGKTQFTQSISARDSQKRGNTYYERNRAVRGVLEVMGINN